MPALGILIVILWIILIPWLIARWENSVWPKLGVVGIMVGTWVVFAVTDLSGPSDPQNNTNDQPRAVLTRPETATPKIQKIIFAGKVINSETDEWPNDRLVLIYLHGKEIGRAISATGEFPENKLGVLDGLFIIPIDNTYQLTPNSFKVDEDTKPTTELSHTMVSPLKAISATVVPSQENEKVELQLTTGTYSEGIYHWFELEEGSQVEIRVPAKNLTYIVKSIAGNKSTLPSDLLTANSTRLTNNNEIVVALPEDTIGQAQNISSESIPIGDFQYTDIQTRTVILEKLDHPVNNCVSSTLTTIFSDTRTIEHQYQVEVSGEIGAAIALPIPVIRLELFAALQAKYGFEQGQIKTRTIAYRIEAQPHTNQVYYFTWKEVWESGIAQTTANDDKITIPYKVKTSLVYDVDSKELGCN